MEKSCTYCKYNNESGDCINPKGLCKEKYDKFQPLWYNEYNVETNPFNLESAANIFFKTAINKIQHLVTNRYKEIIDKIQFNQFDIVTANDIPDTKLKPNNYYIIVYYHDYWHTEEYKEKYYLINLNDLDDDNEILVTEKYIKSTGLNLLQLYNIAKAHIPLNEYNNPNNNNIDGIREKLIKMKDDFIKTFNKQEKKESVQPIQIDIKSKEFLSDIKKCYIEHKQEYECPYCKAKITDCYESNYLSYPILNEIIERELYCNNC